MHVIVASNTPAVARAYVRLVCLLTELGISGHGPCNPTVEVRPVPDHQGRLL